MQGHFTNIVACTDFSEVGDRAIRVAHEMGQASGAHITLLHVVEPMPPPPPPTLLAPVMPVGLGAPEEMSQLLPSVEQHLHALVPDDATIHTQVELGEPVHEILRVAQALNADLIVVGTHGRHGAARWLLGSTAERVVRHAGCAVLVVH